MKMSAQLLHCKQTSQISNMWLSKGSSAYQLHIETLSKHHMGSQPCTIQEQYESFSQPEWKEETQSCILLWFPMREESCLFHYPALSHPRVRSARRYLISVGPSPARSRLWTASPPPWPAACTGVRLASHHTPHPHHSQLSPGQCCTSGEPLASSGTLPGDTEEKRKLPWQQGRKEEAHQQERQVRDHSAATTYASGPIVSNATTSKGCHSHCRSIYLLQQRLSSFS